MAAAAVLKGAAADWPPALLAALELETIVQHGAEAANGPAHPDLQKVVDSLRKLAAEPRLIIPRNRFERRREAATLLPRRERVRRMVG